MIEVGVEGGGGIVNALIQVVLHFHCEPEKLSCMNCTYGKYFHEP